MLAFYKSPKKSYVSYILNSCFTLMGCSLSTVNCVLKVTLLIFSKPVCLVDVVFAFKTHKEVHLTTMKRNI